MWLLLKSWIYSSQFTRCILVPHSHTFQPNQIFCLPFCFYSFINLPFNLLQLPVTMVGSGVAGRQEGPGWCGQHFTFKVRFLNPAKDWKCWPHHTFCPSRGHVLSSCPSKLSCYPSEEDNLYQCLCLFLSIAKCSGTWKQSWLWSSFYSTPRPNGGWRAAAATAFPLSWPSLLPMPPLPHLLNWRLAMELEALCDLAPTSNSPRMSAALV